MNPDGTLSPKQLGSLQDLVNLLSKEEMGIKVEVNLDAQKPEEIGGHMSVGAYLNQKALMGAENLLARPIVFAVGAVGGAVAAVIHGVKVLYGAVKGLFAGSGDNRWATFKSSIHDLKEDLLLASMVRPVAGVFGYFLSFSPVKSGIHKLSEKLDNWALKGKFVDDAKLAELVVPKGDAKILIILGVGNNSLKEVVDNFGKVSNCKTFFHDKLEQNILSTYFKNPETRDKALQVLAKMDFVAPYTGNLIMDVVFSAFEKSGWSIVSRKILPAYEKMDYEMTLAHSAGAYVYDGRKDNIRTKLATLIGAEGADLGRYKDLNPETTSKTGFEHDLVTHVAPMENGKAIGVQYGFGPSNSVQHIPAPGNPKFYDIVKNHDLVNYLMNELPQLIKLME